MKEREKQLGTENNTKVIQQELRNKWIAKI